MTVDTLSLDTHPQYDHGDYDPDMADLNDDLLGNTKETGLPLTRDELVVLAVGAGVLIASGAAAQYRRINRK